MLSLYLHIPFCKAKCKYCSFFVTPENLVEEGKMAIMKQEYLQLLLNQIQYRKQIFPDEQIKTLYVWGGTPFQLGKDNLIQVIETVFSTRNCEQLEEVSIELNPDPIDDTLLFVEEVTKKREHLFRLRFSFGIQSFDNKILQSSKRAYTYEQLPDFLRKLQKIKWANVVYNLDFIAFGDTVLEDKKDKEGTEEFIPRWEEQRVFFEKLVHSFTFDGFSLYTLELFPWSDRYNTQKVTKKTSDEKESIYDEFDWLASVVQNAWYGRYELSNFALPWKRSIHNMVYRTMWSYLGLGINASSMVSNELASNIPELNEKISSDVFWVRFKGPDHRKEINQWKFIDTPSIHLLDEKNRLIDELMLKLRTDQRITQWERYDSILEKNRKTILEQRQEQEIIDFDEQKGRQMTDLWLDLYNSVVTDLIVFWK